MTCISLRVTSIHNRYYSYLFSNSIAFFLSISAVIRHTWLTNVTRYCHLFCFFGAQTCHYFLFHCNCHIGKGIQPHSLCNTDYERDVKNTFALIFETQILFVKFEFHVRFFLGDSIGRLRKLASVWRVTRLIGGREKWPWSRDDNNRTDAACKRQIMTALIRYLATDAVYVLNNIT